MSDPGAGRPAAASSARGAVPAAAAARYRRQLGVVWALAALAGAGALFADGAPTGLGVADAVWRVVLAGSVVVAAAFAQRSTWIVATGIAATAVVGGETYAVVLGVAALVVAIGTSVVGPRNPVLGALAVGLGVQALLRLPDVGFNGLTALLTAVAVVPVYVSAYRRIGARLQRRVRRVALVVGVALVVVAIPVGVAAVVAWRSGGSATAESQAWLDAAQRGDQPAVLAHLATAEGAFTDAEEASTAWYVGPARALPVLGPQLEAVATASASGRDIVRAATAVAEIAEIEQLRVQGGRIDVDRLEALRDPMREASAVMVQARDELAALDTTWLLPNVQDRLDRFDSQIDDAAGDAELASQALDVVPALLGGDGLKRYLLIFTSPAETRELGGFMGNWGELTADDGVLELTRTGRATDLNTIEEELGEGEIPLADPARYPSRYLGYQPWQFWQNIAGTPDLPDVAAMAGELYPQVTGDPIDGVFVIDPIGLGALLALTGPITVDGFDGELTTDNAADFLLREQYVQFPETDARADFLERVSRATFERLTTGDLPGPRFVSESLGAAVAAGHLQFWAYDDATHPLIERLGLANPLSVPAGDDALLVTVANANPNKIDAYLHRIVRYDLDVDPDTGEASGTVTVELRNEAPLDRSDYVIGNTNDDPHGSNRTLLSLYTPLEIESATLDGGELAFERHREYGLRRAAAFVVVPPQGRSTVTFTVRGHLRADGAYRLVVRTPALVHADQIEVTVRGAGAAAGSVPELVVSGVEGGPSGQGSVAFVHLGEAVVEGRLRGPTSTRSG